ncbi:hypothetical protein FRC07_010214 [Ceratobasidium sp. 392]|nr:hypothetical protein FRC07_010214 [Ceratobasidium sp. 392]
MRFLVVALAVFSAVLAQDPEGLPSSTTSINSQVTPRTWASSASTKPPTLPTYTPQSVSWTTITSEGTLYQIAIPQRTIAWTTITSGGSIWKVPVSSSTSVRPAVATATAVPEPTESTPTHSSHKTRTIVLSVVLSFLGALILLLAAMFFMRIRNQRRIRNRRSWAMRPGGWVTEQKEAYPLDVEVNDRAPFAEPQVPAPAPSHTRQRSM